MSCVACEKAQQLGGTVFYRRWKIANLAVVGCEEHVKEMLDLLNKLPEKANNLARLVERTAYAPVAGYYQSRGNDAPLRLLRMAVKDIDDLTNKGGTR